MRFGEWEEILRQPQPAEYLPVTLAIWHYARASALAAQDEVVEAQAEQEAFRQAVAALPADAMLQLNPAAQGLAIAEAALAGEIAFRQGKLDEAVMALTEAVRLEDDLRYMEPPDWLQPARHSLGAVLLSAGRVEEAERVYREDLERWPENGWALFGLAQALKQKGSTEATEVEARFAKAWEHADIRISATCLCVLPVAR